ncbi:MAG: adenylate/guanylate cyclase domain-containing protein [Stappiaceae bacterium]
MERKLAAIMAMDVVGYSRLMGVDETGTFKHLNALLKTRIKPEIKKSGGRIVKLMGDGLLAEFRSVVKAVECASAIQVSVAEAEQKQSEHTRIELRIGINVGDILIEGTDIYGDGVNIAARLEGLSDPGGICISGKVHEEIRDRLNIPFEDLGEKDIKNIERPIRVFRWCPDGVFIERLPLSPVVPTPLPDKPSIAVLPFDNMSSDPDQDFFADGIAEDIITELSRMPWFFVIARNSSFAYKGQAVDIKKVSAELGVRYVLEGSVRKAGGRLRITAQLIDATDGKHVWADRYDREIVDIFDVQDEVTRSIVGAIAPQFLTTEARKARRKDPAKLNAWECVVRGRALLWKFGRDDALEAKKLFERAIELAPSGEFGTSDLALFYFLEAYYRWSDSPQKSLDTMVVVAERAVASDDSDPLALTILSWANTVANRWNEILPPVERAIKLCPNFAPAIGIRGSELALLGRPEEGIEAINAAIRLSPLDGFLPIWMMGLFWANHVLENYEQAVDVAERAIRIAPNNPTFRRQLASAHAHLGQLDQARAAMAEYLRLEPGHTIADGSRVPTKIPEHLARFVEGLRKAGLPE